MHTCLFQTIIIPRALTHLREGELKEQCKRSFWISRMFIGFNLVIIVLIIELFIYWQCWLKNFNFIKASRRMLTPLSLLCDSMLFQKHTLIYTTHQLISCAHLIQHQNYKMVLLLCSNSHRQLPIETQTQGQAGSGENRWLVSQVGKGWRHQPGAQATAFGGWAANAFEQWWCIPEMQRRHCLCISCRISPRRSPRQLSVLPVLQSPECSTSVTWSKRA